MATKVKELFISRNCHVCKLDRQNSAKRDWTSCSKCNSWYHNSCVGLSKKISASLPAWVCHQCNNTSLHTSAPNLDSIQPPSTEPSADLSDVLFKVFDRLRRSRTVNRIPKGSRAYASRVLSQSIQKILEIEDANSVECVDSWINFFVFSTCLERPSSNDNTSLTTKIKQQIKEYEDWIGSTSKTYSGVFSNGSTNICSHSKFSSKTQPKDQYLKRAISKKIEQFDIKGAARLASTSDKVAPLTAENLNILRSLHPPRCASSPDHRNESQTLPFIFDVSAVKSAIRSFQAGSAAGPDGLSPDHLKDLTSQANPESRALLENLTSLINLIVSGSVPDAIKPFLFGANLIAFLKPEGGLRPIAIGNTLRRLCSKLCAKKGFTSLENPLFPQQLGYGYPLGSEGIIHAARAFTEKGDILIKLDLKNAFNSLSRDKILHRVQSEIPGIFNYVNASYGQTSHLFIKDYNNKDYTLLQSAEGVQQGDPLGSLLFCTTIHPIVSQVNTPFNAWYLDDGAIGGNLSEVSSGLRHVLESFPELGLSVNPIKTEVFINQAQEVVSSSIRQELDQIVSGLTFVEKDNLKLLGAPLSSEAVDPVLSKKLTELNRLCSNLKILDAHVALYLLKNCFAIPKINHILRTSGCFLSDRLQEFDSSIRLSLECLMNTKLDEASWNQATLPSTLGGLGIRKASEVALPAFLASSHGTKNIVSSLLPESFVANTGSLFDIASSKWSGNTVPDTSKMSQQKAWDSIIFNARADRLLQESSNPSTRARLLATRAAHANDWIEAIPVSQLGLKLNDTQLRITVSLQLGAPLCHPHTCICGSTTDQFGHHGLSCNKNGGRFSRHVEANDIIKRALQSAKIPSILEPSGLDRDDGHRPDGVTLCPWANGKQAVWDFTCWDTLAPSHISKTALEANAAAREAEDFKKRKYSKLNNNYLLVPIGAETLGGWGPSATKFLTSVGRLLFGITGEPRSTQFLFQRLSLAIKKGNTTALLSCLPTGKGLEELNFL